MRRNGIWIGAAVAVFVGLPVAYAVGRKPAPPAGIEAEAMIVRGPIAALDLEGQAPTIQISERGQVRIIAVNPERLHVVYEGRPVDPAVLEVGQFVKVRLIGWSGHHVVRSIEIVRPGDPRAGRDWREPSRLYKVGIV
jgi:hypothetical protein